MPFESTRVCLQPIRGVEGSDYINASCIDGYRSAKDFSELNRNDCLESADVAPFEVKAALGFIHLDCQQTSKTAERHPSISAFLNVATHTILYQS